MPSLINIPNLTSSSPQKELLRQFERIRCLAENDTNASVLLGALKSLLKVKGLKEFNDVKDILEDFAEWYKKRAGDKESSKKKPSTKKEIFDTTTIKNIGRAKGVQLTLIKDQGKLQKKLKAIKQKHKVRFEEKRKQENKLKEFRNMTVRTNTGNYQRLKQLMAGVTAAEMEILRNKDCYNEIVWRQKKGVADILQLTAVMAGDIQRMMSEILQGALTKLAKFAQKYENSEIVPDMFRKIQVEDVCQRLYSGMCSTYELHGSEKL